MEDPQPSVQTELSRRLKAARALSGKKVRELADELGWDQGKVYRLESGAQVPTAIELNLIARATGQSMSYFFGGASSDPGVDSGASGPHPLAGVKAENGDEDEV